MVAMAVVTHGIPGVTVVPGEAAGMRSQVLVDQDTMVETAAARLLVAMGVRAVHQVREACEMVRPVEVGTEARPAAKMASAVRMVGMAVSPHRSARGFRRAKRGGENQR